MMAAADRRPSWIFEIVIPLNCLTNRFEIWWAFSHHQDYDFFRFSDFAQIHDGGVLTFLCEKVSILATNDSIATSHAD
jgi:hypothetical protein